MPDDQGICDDARFQTMALSSAPGGALRFERQVLWVPPFPADSVTGCPLELAVAATAAGATVCGSTVLKVHYVEAF